MDDFHQTLDELFYIASAACSEIKQFQPDFVAILLHGGWPIYHAANALWKQTEMSPFPVAFPINIGREKEKRYSEHRQLFSFSRYGMFAGGYTDQAEVGYFLNWVPQQSDWIDWVRTYAAGLGFHWEQVERILILDDTFFEGGTFFLSQQLFESSFPAAEVRFLSGQYFEWRTQLSRPWMDQHQVSLPEDPTYTIGRAFWRAATETADIAPESFDWQPLHADLQELQPLAPILPIQTWLELNTWIRDQIIQSAADWIHAHYPEENHRIWKYGFSASDLLFRHVWKYGSITSIQLAEITGLPLKKARQLLRRYYEDGRLVLRETENGRVYQLSPRYNRKDWPDENAIETFWVLPGRLLSGAFPGWISEDVMCRHFSILHAEGLELLVELDPEEEDWAELLGKLGIGYLSIPCEADLYDPAWIETALDVLERIINRHQTIYVTSRSDMVLGLILGCFLVQQGASGMQALRRLKYLRRNMSENWLPFPSDLRARKIVKEWKT